MMFESVGRSCGLTGHGIGQVADGLRHGAKGGWRLSPAHGTHEWYSHEGLFSFVVGKSDCETGAVIGGKEHAVEAVLDVVLAEEDGSPAWVCMAD